MVINFIIGWKLIRKYVTSHLFTHYALRITYYASRFTRNQFH